MSPPESTVDSEILAATWLPTWLQDTDAPTVGTTPPITPPAPAATAAPETEVMDVLSRADSTTE